MSRWARAKLFQPWHGDIRLPTYKIRPSTQAQGESWHQGARKYYTHHTSHAAVKVWRCQFVHLICYKTSSVFNNDKLTRQTFPHVNHPSFLDHPDGQAVRTWLSSEYWCWWPCVRRVRQQTGCTGWGGGGGMQQMTAMQILEINCITGSLLFWGSILNANIALQIYSQRLLLKNLNIYGPII